MTAITFFFCDYKSPESQKLENVLSALSVQLAMQSNSCFDLLEEYYDELHPKIGLEKEQDSEYLMGLLRSMMSQYDRVFLVVDGLDECGDAAVEVSQALKQLAEERQVSTALFSRSEEEIRDELIEAFLHIEIAAHTEDLELYVLAEMEKRKSFKNLGVKNPELHEHIRRTLVEGANGM